MGRGAVDYRDPRTHVLEETDRAHVNSVCFLPDGDMLISLGRITPNRMKRLWQVKQWLQRKDYWRWVQASSRLVWRLTGMAPARHSSLLVSPGSYDSIILRVAPDGTSRIWKRWSNVMVPMHSLRTLPDGHVLYNNTDTGEVLKMDAQTGDVLTSVQVDTAFLRGNFAVSEHRVFVGSQNRLFDVNLQEGRVTRSLVLDDDARSSVFAIGRLPDDMAPLPSRLPVAGAAELVS